MTRSCFSVQAINENKDEDNDELGIKTSKPDMIIDIKLEHVHSMQRKSSLKKDDHNRKSRPMLVEFARHNERHNIFSNKNHIPSKNINYRNLNQRKNDKTERSKGTTWF